MTNFLDPLRRALRWHRRLLAALLAGLAAYLVLTELTDRGDTTRVVVAARTIDGGRTIGARDLTTLELPRAAVPEGAITDAGEALGRAVLLQVPARAALTASALAGSESLVAPGRVALPLTLAESAPVALVGPGDRIDVLGPGPSGVVEVLASEVRVIAIPELDTGLLGGGAPVLLVDVDRRQAAVLVAAGSPLSFALN